MSPSYGIWLDLGLTCSEIVIIVREERALKDPPTRRHPVPPGGSFTARNHPASEPPGQVGQPE